MICVCYLLLNLNLNQFFLSLHTQSGLVLNLNSKLEILRKPTLILMKIVIG